MDSISTIVKLKNTNLSEITDIMELRNKAVKILESENENQSSKLMELISKRIIQKAVDNNPPEQLIYYWLIKLQNRELQRQKYSEFKSCPLFSSLFL